MSAVYVPDVPDWKVLYELQCQAVNRWAVRMEAVELELEITKKALRNANDSVALAAARQL